MFICLFDNYPYHLQSWQIQVVKNAALALNLLDLTRENIEVILGVEEVDFRRKTRTGRQISSEIRS
jgi:hypothetical protein